MSIPAIVLRFRERLRNNFAADRAKPRDSLTSSSLIFLPKASCAYYAIQNLTLLRHPKTENPKRI